jgi:predicted N-acetyltransferase YhbS
MDVHPDWQRKEIGRALVRTLVWEARTRGLNGATLTTDRLAVFNAPFYQSIGFWFADPHDAPPHLHATLEAEAAAGLDLTRRVAMVLSFEGVKD